MTLVDISPPVGADSPVWPGDTPYASQVHWPMTGASPVLVNRLTTTPHVGAHADAPAHFLPGGAAIGDVGLEPYVGPCTVLHCRPGSRTRRDLITVDDVRAAVHRAAVPVEPRLLLRTYDTLPTAWDDDFAGLAPEVLHWLADAGGVLVGVDAASLDPMVSKGMEAHRTAADRGLAILENLCLDEVAEGVYELIALPLRLIALDASPVRAVLRPVGDRS